MGFLSIVTEFLLNLCFNATILVSSFTCHVFLCWLCHRLPSFFPYLYPQYSIFPNAHNIPVQFLLPVMQMLKKVEMFIFF